MLGKLTWSSKLGSQADRLAAVPLCWELQYLSGRHTNRILLRVSNGTESYDFLSEFEDM